MQTTTAPAPRRSPRPSQWGEEWIVLPDGDAIHRDDLGPCAECGQVEFRIYASEQTTSAGKRTHLNVACPNCVKPAWERKDRMSGEVLRTAEIAVGWFNGLTGAIRLEAGGGLCL